MKIGYVRSSVAEANALMQIRALVGVGIDQIYLDDEVSGREDCRPAWEAALGTLEPGDHLVIWSFDRIAHSIRGLISELTGLSDRGVNLMVIRDRIDASGEVGQEFFRVIDQFRQFAENTVHERQIFADSKRPVGRPSKISDEQWQIIKNQMANDLSMTAARAARLLGVTRQAISKRLKKEP